MQEQVLFSKLSSNLKVDLCAYINGYIEEYADTDIMIGCNSQNYAESTIYAVEVALYKKRQRRAFVVQEVEIMQQRKLN